MHSQTTPAPRRSRWPKIIGFTSAGIVLLFFAAIMIPCFVDSKTAADESSAVGSLRTLATAQKNFSEQHPEKGFAGSLTELGPSGANEVDAALASGIRSGYIFTLIPGARDSEGHITKYAVTAVPQTFDKTGVRSFFVDESGVIRYTAQNRPVTSLDPPLS